MPFRHYLHISFENKVVTLFTTLRGLKMAGGIRGGLRPHHPAKHSFILVGLVVVIIVIGFNYWSASVKNTRLLAELAKLQKNYKVMHRLKLLVSVLKTLSLIHI